MNVVSTQNTISPAPAAYDRLATRIEACRRRLSSLLAMLPDSIAGTSIGRELNDLSMELRSVEREARAM